MRGGREVQCEEFYIFAIGTLHFRFLIGGRDRCVDFFFQKLLHFQKVLVSSLVLSEATYD